MNIPKAMVVDQIRSVTGEDAAARADAELPEKLDPDTDADVLRGYGLDPVQLRDQFGGHAPAVG